MALVVEDGTGKANAESYISVTDALAYLALRGNATFAAAALAVQEAALRNATEFMVSVYRNQWAGYRAGIVQALDWPRAYVPITDVVYGYGPGATWYDAASVPALVAQACADLAVRALTGPLVTDIARLKKSVKVGPLSVEYNPNSIAQTTYVAVNAKLAPFLSGNGMASLVRT